MDPLSSSGFAHESHLESPVFILPKQVHTWMQLYLTWCTTWRLYCTLQILSDIRPLADVARTVLQNMFNPVYSAIETTQHIEVWHVSSLCYLANSFVMILWIAAQPTCKNELILLKEQRHVNIYFYHLRKQRRWLACASLQSDQRQCYKLYGKYKNKTSWHIPNLLAVYSPYS